MKKLFIVLLSFATFFIACKSEPKELTFEEKVEAMINKMKDNPQWMQDLNQKAINQNMPLDSVIYYDAVWMVNEEGKAAQPQTAAPVADTTNTAPADTVK